MKAFTWRRPGNPILAILAYHKIGDPPVDGWETWNYVAEEIFAVHLDYLAKRGWSFLDHAAFLAGLENPSALPDRAVLITFDDGYRSLLEGATRQLARRKCPAVVFVPTGYIGGSNRFDEDIEPEEAMCDWSDLRKLQESGISVQSHGVSHTAFSELTPAEQEAELVRSKTLLEQGLGRPVDTFSFPYGDPGPDEGFLARLQRSGYRAACLYEGGPISASATDRFRMPRIPIGPDTDLEAELMEAELEAELLEAELAEAGLESADGYGAIDADCAGVAGLYAHAEER